MKKIVSILLMLPLFAVWSGCSDDDELFFDHEKPQFEIKDNAILLEVILPQGSTSTDNYYIIGAFNGGEEEAIGNLEWQLEKSSGSDLKWGIYLYPSSFKEGKTLADGFYFYSKKQGVERDVFDRDVVHTLNVGVGTRTNVWVDRWEAYFGEVERDHHRIYVADNTGWDGLALYAWGADGDVTPGWPGLLPAGTEEINGVTYTYFAISKDLEQVRMNLIFNNNGGGQQFNGPQDHLVNRDFYYNITDGEWEEVDPNVVPYLGYTIYVDDQTEWAELNLYAWADGGDVTPGWPGLQPVGTKEINGTIYTCFEMGEALNNLFMNLIFNGTGGQLADIPITLNRDYYFRLTSEDYMEINPN